VGVLALGPVVLDGLVERVASAQGQALASYGQRSQLSWVGSLSLECWVNDWAPEGMELVLLHLDWSGKASGTAHSGLKLAQIIPHDMCSWAAPPPHSRNLLNLG